MTMKHIETAAIKRLSSAKKRELETLNEQLDTLMEASRRVTSMPKKAEMKAQIQSLKDRMRHLKEQSAVGPDKFYPSPSKKMSDRLDALFGELKELELKKALLTKAQAKSKSKSDKKALLEESDALYDKILLKKNEINKLNRKLSGKEVFRGGQLHVQVKELRWGAKASVQTAGAWPKDFFTALCKASKTSTDDEGSFTEKKASTSTRGHYDGAAVDQGTFATRWLPILKTNRDLVKHDISVEVLHPTKPDKSFGNTDRQIEHVHLIHGFCLKAGKALKIKVAKNAKEFLALAKEQKPVVIVIPHPKHGFEILMSQEADKQAWSK